MRHATDSTLNLLAPFLEELRSIEGLRERKLGVFSRRSKAYLHFHEDPTGIFADVRFTLDEPFERLRVNATVEQTTLLSKIQRSLGG